MASTKVRVSPKDIQNGIPGDIYCCAVARALQRECEDHCAHVYEDAIEGRMLLCVHDYYIDAAEEVKEFVRAFDAGLNPEPLTFSLPDNNDDAWEAMCEECGELCDRTDICEDGCCLRCTDWEETT